MVNISFDESTLLLGRGILGGVASMGVDWMMVVVSPLGEMIGEFQPRGVGRGVLEVDDHQLLVFIRRLKEWRFLVVGKDAKNVAILCLESCY